MTTIEAPAEHTLPRELDRELMGPLLSDDELTDFAQHRLLDLLARCADRDSTALAEWYDWLAPAVLSLAQARGLSADEAHGRVTFVFVRLWHEAWRGQAVRDRGGDVAGWMHQVVHEALDTPTSLDAVIERHTASAGAAGVA